MMSCHSPPPSQDGAGNCSLGGCDTRARRDYMFQGSLAVIAAALLIHIFHIGPLWLTDLGAAIADLLGTMWWGVALSIVVVGIMNKVPRAYFSALLGRGDTMGGVIRATLAGLLLDLCSHGILMVGAKLYERGASLAQVMAFLIASPWNSLSLTLILIALIGLKWTLLFVAGSALIAIVTGWIYLILTRRGMIPNNPNAAVELENIDIAADLRQRLQSFRPRLSLLADVLTDGFRGARMVLRWLLFGTIIAALIRVFVSTDIMVEHFGPTLAGLGLTLLATTIIEVCSEGSAPIGAELVNRAAAPGNGFAFLMAGVSTDYTEIFVLKDMLKSWKLALTLPLLTVPQIVLLGWIMNLAGGG